MKKITIAGLAVISLTWVTSAAHSQLAISTTKFNPATSFAINKSEKINADTKAERDFNKSYKNATNIIWSQLKNGGSLVHFFSDGIQTKIFYNKGGNRLGMIRYYTEDLLPFDIRHLVKSNYYDFSIFLVVEVTVRNTIAYLVKIEDKTCWKTIRIMDGEMNVVEEIVKI